MVCVACHGFSSPSFGLVSLSKEREADEVSMFRTSLEHLMGEKILAISNLNFILLDLLN